MTKSNVKSINATAADILNSGSELRKVEIPELSKGDNTYYVYMKPLSAGDVLDHLRKSEEERGEDNLRLIANNVTDENGNRLFSNDQVNSLRTMRAAIYARLTAAIAEEVEQAASSAGETTEGNVSSKTNG